jgi:hypothetical protein
VTARSRRVPPPLAALCPLLAPAVAQACAVCGGGDPANRFAFFASTIALSLLPLGLFVGAFLWLRSRLAERRHVEFREREHAAAGTVPPAAEPGARPS